MECILLLRANYLKLFIPITVLLLLSFPVLASRQEQKVTLNVINKTLKNVFHSIEEQTDVLIMYDLAVIDDNEKVSINVKEMVLEDVLNKLFHNKSVKWSKKGNVVRVFMEVTETENVKLSEPGDPVLTITGRVTDDENIPLPFANVLIKASSRGISTDNNGNFTLGFVPENAIIIISYTGFESKEISLKGRKKIDVILRRTINRLDETVIQGYGTTTRRLTTSNIGRITAEEIEKQPVMNPLLALQGKIAGLDITQTNGFASAPIKVELRGRSSINSQFTSDPLYIIDGVPLTVLDVSGSSSYQGGSSGFLQSGISGPASGQSPFFNINPADIESIEVLKDADATAIYGSRGANGVILITTKKGKVGRTKFDAHIQQGISKQTRFWKMLNTQQYLQMRREAFKNDQAIYGDVPNFTIPDNSNAYDLLVWDTTHYTDWQKVLYGGTGKTTDAQISLSGGDAHTTFRIGAGYNHTTNILTVSGADQRASVSLNFTHYSKNERFSISFTNGYTFTQSDMINLPSSITLPPNAPPIYDSGGNLNYEGWGEENTAARGAYPFANLKSPYNAKTNFLNSNLILDYKPVKGLRLSTSIGYNNAQNNQQQFVLIASQDPSINPTGRSQLGINSNKNWIVEPQVNYDVKTLIGRISVLAGASLQETNTQGLYSSGEGFTSDALIQSISNASVQLSADFQGKYRYAAIFGRVTYNWDNKYILNFNVRRDGSSRFGSGKQFGNFGSVGAAWNFTEENWFKHNFNFLSFGKLRGSYGLTGSDAVGDYQYLTQWTSSRTLPYNGISTLSPTLHANPNFQWQVNKKLEGAIDLGFLKDRLNISIAYYRNRCGNQLVRFPTPALSGFTNVTANSPALVENSGLEFTFGGAVVRVRDFTWSANFNATINRNKLLAYPNISQSPYAGKLIIGKSLNIKRILQYTGVDTQTGEYIFQDRNNDHVITYNDAEVIGDDTYAANLSPKFLGGVGMNFNYKSWQLNLFFQVKKQLGANVYSQMVTSPGMVGNQPLAIFGQEWKKQGDVANVARFSTTSLTSANFFGRSDGVYTDASFIRLSNLSLSYSLPTSYMKKIGMQACNIFLHTNNLFTITKYKGIDPETQSFGSLPPARTIVGGLSFSL